MSMLQVLLAQAAFFVQEVDELVQLIFTSHCYDSANYLTSCSKGQDPNRDHTWGSCCKEHSFWYWKGIHFYPFLQYYNVDMPFVIFIYWETR